MNPSEILRSDFLDILFEKRNKSYGAYTLRKFYAGRLTTATGVGLGLLFSLAFVFHLNDPDRIEGAISALNKEVVASLVDLPEEEKPVVPEPERPRQTEPVASTQFTTNIQIDNTNLVTDVPEIGDLENRAIDVVTNEGREPVVAEPIRTNEVVKPIVEEEKPAPEAIQRQPEFPGGKEAWARFLSKYLVMPEELEAGEKKTVLIRFLVSEDGSITNFTVVQSGGKAFDNEVIRVLKKMPKWSPAIQNGRHVAVTFTQPVTFQSIGE